MKEPLVHVGLLAGVEIHFLLQHPFSCEGIVVSGLQTVTLLGGKIRWNGKQYPTLSLIPHDSTSATFEVYDLAIGIQFHWERRVTQRFRGSIRIEVDKDTLVLINAIPVEDYLESVITSEMSASASFSLLKAHAVISRSWLFAQLQKRGAAKSAPPPAPLAENPEYIRWFDREAHTLFEVCADDHCQRYQGITGVHTSQEAALAVRETRGEVLLYEDQLCDTRFSKCCGGAMERFSTCWDDTDYPYLTGKRDGTGNLPDLTLEAVARDWILSEPDAYCKVNEKQILSQVLTHYDQETPDFYRWKVTYSQKELSALVARKLEVDFGTILDLVPLQRGTSGRISRLRIVGSRCTKVIGKELLIRSALSESHLYSSAFVVERSEELVHGIPTVSFLLCGAGWGHGVGLCQIGAAVLGERGYDYKAILLHYYPDTMLEKINY